MKAAQRIGKHVDPVWVAIEYVILERDRLQEDDRAVHQACEFGTMTDDGQVLDNRCDKCRRMDSAWAWLRAREDWRTLLQRAELLLGSEVVQ